MFMIVVVLYKKIATLKNMSLHIVEFEDRLVDEKYALLCTAWAMGKVWMCQREVEWLISLNFPW